MHAHLCMPGSWPYDINLVFHMRKPCQVLRRHPRSDVNGNECTGPWVLKYAQEDRGTEV